MSQLSEKLALASTKKQVKQLIEKNGYQAMNEAWAELSDLQRSSLELMRRFDGTIIHEPGSESDSVRDQ